MLYSGSIRYYANRPIVRYDRLPEDALDRVIADLTRHGYRPYLVIERSEDDRWCRLFKNRTPLGVLDWPAEVVFDHSAGIRIFDLTKRPPLK